MIVHQGEFKDYDNQTERLYEVRGNNAFHTKCTEILPVLKCTISNDIDG